MLRKSQINQLRKTVSEGKPSQDGKSGNVTTFSPNTLQTPSAITSPTLSDTTPPKTEDPTFVKSRVHKSKTEEIPAPTFKPEARRKKRVLSDKQIEQRRKASAKASNAAKRKRFMERAGEYFDKTDSPDKLFDLPTAEAAVDVVKPYAETKPIVSSPPKDADGRGEHFGDLFENLDVEGEKKDKLIQNIGTSDRERTSSLTPSLPEPSLAASQQVAAVVPRGPGAEIRTLKNDSRAVEIENQRGFSLSDFYGRESSRQHLHALNKPSDSLVAGLIRRRVF